MKCPTRSVNALRPAAAAALRGELSELYELAQTSPHIFASPLGPFALGGESVHLPRFVFFGPHAISDSWRLAFLAGFDARETRPSRALIAVLRALATDADTGHGLNVSFFPIVDAAGLELGWADRQLATRSWKDGATGELHLLRQEARQRNYQGFVRVEAGAGPRLRWRFERAPTSSLGPRSIGSELAVRPFELVLEVPIAWPDRRFIPAAAASIGRFLRRYRAFQAYGQHL